MKKTLFWLFAFAFVLLAWCGNPEVVEVEVPTYCENTWKIVELQEELETCKQSIVEVETGTVETWTIEEVTVNHCRSVTVEFPEQPKYAPKWLDRRGRSDFLGDWMYNNMKIVSGDNYKTIKVVFRKPMTRRDDFQLRTTRSLNWWTAWGRVYVEVWDIETTFDLWDIKVWDSKWTNYLEEVNKDFKVGAYVGLFQGEGVERIIFSTCEL